MDEALQFYALNKAKKLDHCIKILLYKFGRMPDIPEASKEESKAPSNFDGGLIKQKVQARDVAS